MKRGAEQTFYDIGLSMSTAINIFLKKVARERRIPFETTADPFYCESNMCNLEKKMEDYKAGELELRGITKQIRAIQWDFDDWEDYLYWQRQDKKMLKRINQLIKDIRESCLKG